jgi:CRISPR/Cas system-associated exonuclease Cas4 (RecB family)
LQVVPVKTITSRDVAMAMRLVSHVDDQDHDRFLAARSDLAGVSLARKEPSMTVSCQERFATI